MELALKEVTSYMEIGWKGTETRKQNLIERDTDQQLGRMEEGKGELYCLMTGKMMQGARDWKQRKHKRWKMTPERHAIANKNHCLIFFLNDKYGL